MFNRFVVFLAIAAGLIGALYVALCVLLYVMQGDMIFYRVVNDAALQQQWQDRRVEISSDDATIEGWWTENPNAAGNVTLLYFGGNAEDVLRPAQTMSRFHARRMLVTNYRGYGRSTGKPSEQALFHDALAIYDYAVKQSGVSPEGVIVVGRSLGSGVAVHLAANRPVRGAILITPYDSIASVAQEQYPYFPVSFLLRHKFLSDASAPKITAPVLLIAGERDGVVPPQHAQRLFELWAGAKQIYVLPNVGHNNIEQHDQYYERINSFVEQTIAH